MNLIAAYYVVLVGVFFPAVCIRALYKLKAGAPFPPKPVVRKQTLIMHGLTFLLAWLTWRSFRLPLFPPYAIQWKHAAVGVAILMMFVSGAYPLWKKMAVTNRVSVYRNMPQAPNEMSLWILMSISAGFAEEIVYRGVLFGILMHWMHRWWTAALLCAVIFAVSHAFQGWLSVLVILVIAIVFQGLVWYTGTLYVAMVVHAVFDCISGLTYNGKWRARGDSNARPCASEAHALSS